MTRTPHPEIVAAWAEHCSGPGWSNRLIHYAYYRDGKFVVECLQPEEQTPGMSLLFGASVAITDAMSGAVQEKLDYRRKP